MCIMGAIKASVRMLEHLQSIPDQPTNWDYLRLEIRAFSKKRLEIREGDLGATMQEKRWGRCFGSTDSSPDSGKYRPMIGWLHHLPSISWGPQHCPPCGDFVAHAVRTRLCPHYFFGPWVVGLQQYAIIICLLLIYLFYFILIVIVT